MLSQTIDDFNNPGDVLAVIDDNQALTLHFEGQNDLDKTQVFALITNDSNIVTADKALGNINLETNNHQLPNFDNALYPLVNGVADCVLESSLPSPYLTQIPSAAWNAWTILYLGFLWLYGYRAWDDPNSFWDDPLGIWG